MRKQLFLFLAFSASIFQSNAQIFKGDLLIDPYIGVPNWANSLLYNQYDGTNASATNYNVVGSPLSYGGRFEYMIADKVGIGADVNYEVSGFSYDYIDYRYDASGNVVYDLNNNPLYVNYNAEYKAKKLRAMFRLNYHFFQSEKVDVYSGFAAGYKSVNRTSITTPNDPNNTDLSASGALVPIAMRLAIGTKIYFTPNIGAHVEMGAFGGGLIQFGLSAKF